MVSAQTLNEAGFDRIQLRADDRVVLAEGANLVGKNNELRSVSLNTRVIEAQGAGSHLIRAHHVALGDKDLSKQKVSLMRCRSALPPLRVMRPWPSRPV